MTFTIRIFATLITALAFLPINSQPLNGRDPADDIYYFYMPIAWRDSDNDQYRFGDFNGMTNSLDYLQNLGVTAVWMTPIYPSPAYHGYQHMPANSVNPWFGQETNFWNFVASAHTRGIKVYLDMVAYGVNQNFSYFTNAYNNPSSPYDSWFSFTNQQNTNFVGSSYNSWNGAPVNFVNWNLTNPTVVNQVITWAKHWLDPNNDGNPSDGVDGFRLDHVFVSAPEGWGANLAFWTTFNNSLRQLNPSVFTFCEQGDWGDYGADLMPAFDSAFTKPFEFAARDAMNAEDSFGLYQSMGVTEATLPAGKQYLGTLGDHDIDRLTSVLGGTLAKAKSAAYVLMLQPNPPVIYFGDEIGMLGSKASINSDAADIPNREPFKWNAVAGPPMSNYFNLNSQAYSGRYEHNHDGRSVEEQTGIQGSLLETYRSLITARKNNIGLRRGSYIPVPAVSSKIWSFMRSSSQQNVLVAVNLSGSAVTTTVDLRGWKIAAGNASDLITNQVYTSLTNANLALYPITIPAYGAIVAKVNLIPDVTNLDGLNIPIDSGNHALRTTQTTPTDLGNNISELNQLFVSSQRDGIRVSVTGNLAQDGTGIAVLIDNKHGGQNVLNFSSQSAPPGGPDQLTGMTLDSGFSPSSLIYFNCAGGSVFVDQFYTPSNGATTKTFRGISTVGCGNGVLARGINPNGMKVAFNNSNTAGVTSSSVSGANTAVSGMEMLIPFADIGLSGVNSETINAAVFILKSDGTVTNQWLPGLGAGRTDLGIAPNMNNVTGKQYVSISLPGAADVNGDGCVDDIDLLAIINDFLLPPGTNSGFTGTDINGDGQVDDSDLVAVINNFLAGC